MKRNFNFLTLFLKIEIHIKLPYQEKRSHDCDKYICHKQIPKVLMIYLKSQNTHLLAYIKDQGQDTH